MWSQLLYRVQGCLMGDWCDDLLYVFISLQIPGNTGCIARTCAATCVGLHLVEVFQPYSQPFPQANFLRACLICAAWAHLIPNSWSANVSVVGRDISRTNHMQYFSLQPLGFKIDNSKLKRAGLDYWPYPPYIDISFACDLPCDWLEDSAQGLWQAVRNIYLPNRNIWKGDTLNIW
jgi:tRNA(Leu) C34 or U34 (ribose-2'-O)-methylase TrmL